MIQPKHFAEQIAQTIQRQTEKKEEEELVQPKYEKNSEQFLQRQAEQEEEENLQTKAETDKSAEVSHDLESRINALKGGGRPLSKSERAFFEPRFGVDFSRVSVHTDAQAGGVARDINAQAFTIGRDVVFGAGQYTPETLVGKNLLAHELTHVLQQRDFLPQNIYLSFRRATEPPSQWCVPYSSQEEAKKELGHIFLNVVGTLDAWLGHEVAALWADYLKRKPGDSLTPWIYSDPSSRLVRGFAESETTRDHQRWLLDLLKIKLPVLCKITPTLIRPNQWSFIPVEKLFTENILNYEINWTKSPFDIPAMIAGGVSESDVGKDSRRLSGTVGFFRKTDDQGRTVELTLKTDFRFHVKDCIDFCQGGPGSLAEQEYTVPMSRLEASGLAYDRPFEVYFAPEPLVEELDVLFIEHCFEAGKNGEEEKVS